jgi:acetyl/propionyl-CoA carboxylase alpha subunit
MSLRTSNWYLRNPLIHENRRRANGQSAWEQSFVCSELKPLIICRGPIRIEAMNVFEEMGITGYGMLLSEKDSITYPNALSPELRKQISPERIHRVHDYSGATKEERQQRIRQIVNIARRNGYDSVFAGYGFMAEDEEMVRGLEQAGLNFIGPQSSTIRQAGQKDLAKRTALEVEVSVTPGIDNATVLTLLGRCPDEPALLAIAAENELGLDPADIKKMRDLEARAEAVLDASYAKGIDLLSIDEIADTLASQVGQMFVDNPGYRVRLKAIGGGGGKGQRILNSPDQFEGDADAQLAQAVAQVSPAFLEILSEVKTTGIGDNKNVLAELNIETVRHQEIQVVGNGDWCITMGGRDCSLQMNEQKLLEMSVTREELEAAIAGADVAEAAASLRTDLDILDRMEAEAARFGSAVNLDSVSTFECIVDADHHYFMEMNTRVQVEHRVSELCYALRFVNPEDIADSFTVNSIVELMVLLAVHGKQLPKPHRIQREQASAEVRLNATDQALKPHAGGLISEWSDNLPGEIRDDQGICLHNPDTDVFMKYHLAGAYDSNIALLLSTGTDRATALRSMAEILRRTRLSGENLSTNLQFQYGLLTWLVGQNAQARPATNFVAPYLTAIGQLKVMADNLDIVQAYDAIESARLKGEEDAAVKSAISQIMSQKASLLARAINILFAEPHFLAGWLSLNRHRFEIAEGGITWLDNPVFVLRDLYHYLNMEAEAELPALYAIWDHDQQLLQDAVDFYSTVQEKTGVTDWLDVCAIIDGDIDGDSAFGDAAESVQAAHAGFQLGLEILSILPYIGFKSGFFDFRVLPDLSVQIPSCFLDEELKQESLRALSPPPARSADEVTAPTGGMFYSRESPERETFVAAGDHFNEGDPLFIIEVMKMFNKVYAEFDGTVDQVLIQDDATIVKRGQAVFKVTPDNEVVEESAADINDRVQANTREFLDFSGYLA